MLSTHDALYRTVCDYPDEDTPRLAFADLVEEEGDPDWAAFIRTQVELARVTEYDPLWVKCRQLDPDAFHGHAKTHTLPRLPAGFDWSSFRFRRGFPWQATVIRSAAFLDRGGSCCSASRYPSVGNLTLAPRWVAGPRSLITFMPNFP